MVNRIKKGLEPKRGEVLDELAENEWRPDAAREFHPLMKEGKKKRARKMTTDSKYGWLVVGGTFFVGFITDGLLFSFGIMLVELLDTFNEGRAATVIISSLVTGFMHLVGPVAGLLSEMYGCRVVVIVGSLIAFVGFLISVFVEKLSYLYITYGFLGGVGFGLMYLPASVCVIQHFDKKRSLANGISVCGSGIGTFVFTQITGYLLNLYGWRGTILIEAGIILNGIACGLIFISPATSVDTTLEIDISVITGETVDTSDKTNSAPTSRCDDICLEVIEEGLVGNKQSLKCYKNGYNNGIIINESSIVLEKRSSDLRGKQSEVCVLDNSKHATDQDEGLDTRFGEKTEKSSKTPSMDHASDIKQYTMTPQNDALYVSEENECIVQTNLDHSETQEPTNDMTQPNVDHSKAYGDTSSNVGHNLVKAVKHSTQTESIKVMSYNLQPEVILNNNANICFENENEVSSDSVAVDCVRGSEHCAIGTANKSDNHQEATRHIKKDKTMPETKQNVCKRLCDLSLLRNGKLFAFLLSGFFVNLAFTVPFNFVPDQAIEDGMEKSQSYWLASSIGIANTASRIIIGWIADWKCINRLVLFEVLLFSVGIVTIFSIFMVSFAAKMVYTCAFGFLIGGYIALCPVVLADLFGVDVIARSFGLFMFAVGISGTAASPLAGLLFDHTGSYVISFITAGSEFILGACVLLVPFIVEKFKKVRVN